MGNEDIRWIQRFNNFQKALARLTEAIILREERPLTSLEQQGLIKAFEFTFDLAWKTLQDFLRENKRPNSNGGPNVILAQALRDELIRNDQGWKDLKASRELSSHTYDEETADEIAEKVVNTFYGLLTLLETRLQTEKINKEKE